MPFTFFHAPLPLVRLLLAVAVLAGLLTAPAPAPARAAADTLSVVITSPSTNRDPLEVGVSCDIWSGKINMTILSYWWNGTGWTEQKRTGFQTPSTYRGTAPFACYNAGDVSPNLRFDYTLDASWFPIDGDYHILAVSYNLETGAYQAQSSTPVFPRPITAPTGLSVRGPAYDNGVTTTSTTVTRGPQATVSWDFVDAAAGYQVQLTRPNGSVAWQEVPAAACCSTISSLDGGDGTYSVRVRSVNGAGRPGPFAPEQTITRDTVAPDAPSAVAVAPATSNTRPRAVTWTGTGPSGAWRYKVTLDGPNGLSRVWERGFAWDCLLNGGVNCSWGTFGLQPGDPEGSYTLRMQAYDQAGNLSGASAPTTFVYDTTPPEAPASITAPPAVNGEWVAVSYAAVPDAARYRLVRRGPDGALTTPFLFSGTSLQWQIGTAEGSHELRVYAEDAAGNVSASYRAVTVERDTVAPPASNAPDAPALTNSDSIGVTWAGTPDTARYLLVLTRPNSSVVTRTVEAPAVSVGDLLLDGGDGAYMLALVAEDRATNQSARGAAATIVRDTTPPPALLSAPTGITLTNALSATVSWPAIATVATSVVTITEPSGLARGVLVPAPGTSTIVALSAGDGAYRVTVAGRDAAGNTAQASPALTITRDTIGPLAAASAPVLPSRTNALTTTLTWPAVADAVAYEVWVNGARLTTVPTTSAVISGADGEVLRVTIRGIDLAGNVGAFTPEATTTIDQTAPEVGVTFTPAPDGSGVAFGWATEPGTSAQLVRVYADDREETVAATNPVFFSAAFGEAVQGRLRIADGAGNVVVVPFGPLTPNNLQTAARVEDTNGGALLPGDLLVLTLTVSNTGTADQPATTLTLPLPAGLTLISSEPAPAGTDPLRWSLGLLPSGGTRTVQLAVRVAPGSSGKDVSLAPVVASSIAPEQRVTADVAGSDGVVQLLGGTLRTVMQVTDANGGDMAVGDTLTIALTTSAEGAAFSGVVVDLPLPAWLVVALSTTRVTGGAALPWLVGELALGQARTLTLHTTIAEAGRGQTLTLAPETTSDQEGSVAATATRVGTVVDPRDPSSSQRTALRLPCVIR